MDQKQQVGTPQTRSLFVQVSTQKTKPPEYEVTVNIEVGNFFYGATSMDHPIHF